jgi:hypothetical protein
MSWEWADTKGLGLQSYTFGGVSIETRKRELDLRARCNQ